MSLASIDFLSVVRSCIPEEAEVVQLQQEGEPAAILYADVDGDGFPEITALYRYLGNQYLFSLKEYSGNWFPIASASTGRHLAVRDFAAAPISRTEGWDVVIGWEKPDETGAELDIIQWTQSGYQRVIPYGTTYNHVEIEDMPTRSGQDGRCEIALWIQEKGQAYRIDTYRWEPHKLVPTTDVHGYYFQKVARYYEDLTREQPNEQLYRTYLEEAQKKAGNK
ncbi:hypothetical protein [Paenibacillus roseipurpureus]|uniref:Uncharacterized protein n=1 Tax=Paenibacillus roseopurpureus TaxID=2918901 RepID=A0AA96LJ30_9BACL|nr:hypothetical protein [Paenibacillus sp. MBLB1832]WNR42630.1 hypothetical protein MJB10_16055 [Paenibacillus sp. MBLB1832]